MRVNSDCSRADHRSDALRSARAAARPSLAAARRPRRASASTSAGHQANSSCSSSGLTVAPGAQPRLADEHHHPIARAGPAPRPVGARARRSTPPASSRASVSVGFSSTSTEPPAPSAQRPAQDATQAARRPASQLPSESRTTHSAEMLSPASAEAAAAPSGSVAARAAARRAVCWKLTIRAASPSWARRAALAQRCSSIRSASALASAPGSNASPAR